MLLVKRTLTWDELYDMQNELNVLTVGENWRDVITISKLKAAMFDEFSELLNSASWKWWKKAEPANEWNLRIEAIDILHFAISTMINKKIVTSHDNDLGTWSVYNYKSDGGGMVTSGGIDHYLFMDIAMDVLNNPEKVNRLIHVVIGDHDEASAIYTAKWELNKIRQESGYKNGTYKKLINGKEDNELIKMAVDKFLQNERLDLEYVREEVRHLMGASDHV